MARAVWSGALSAGVVPLPIQLVTATESHVIRFHQIQRGTADRVRNKRVNERTGEEVPLEEIVKGHEVDEGYVLVEPKELDEIAPGRSKSLEISGFVDLAEIYPIFRDTTYYLAPGGREYTKVYSLLCEALARSKTAGIATFVMRGREYLGAVTAEGGALALHRLRWADEVRDVHHELPGLPTLGQGRTERELQMAIQLVEAMKCGSEPGEYRDTYQDRVRELVEAKSRGESVEKAEPPPSSTHVVDLMNALRARVEQAKTARRR
ncbi:DNA end-binding protein Ku [Streptomyces sp. NBRC 110611]|uniref:non-homologous end joining protein Ku n=1 Tax=Streptomyces sp. NBRC 110611 TaxID=1621259 RepID=UPI00082FDD4A|nr:Ku protein [Streptomyces sp. NBRC 110611]GAU71448.1 DNA end-binding protein Ku [Streptomyces sp. NBRC 110611]